MNELPFFILLTFLTSLCHAQTECKAAGGIDGILKTIPGYHVLTLDEHDAEAKRFFVENRLGADPSIVHADFNGDGTLDYALLAKNNQTGRTQVFIFLCSGAEYKNAYPLDVTGAAEITYLQRTRFHSLAAVSVVYFEKARVLLYWDKKANKIREYEAED